VSVDYAVARRECLSPVCPEGNIWGHCHEPSHWPEEARRDDYGSVSSTQPEMTTAHLAHTSAYNLAHVITHLDQAMKTKDPKDRDFNLEHVQHHVEEVRDHLERLIQHLRDNYPKEGKALDELDNAIADTNCESGDVASSDTK
jgi:hypothetical protein